jgi:signal transduction histidine kinase
MGSIQLEEPRLQQIRKLTEVSRALTNAASLDEIFQLTVDRAADLLAADQALLMLADGHGLLTPRSSHGVDAALAGRIGEPLNETLVPRLARLLGAKPENFLGVPMVVGGAIKGILVVIRSTTAAVTDIEEWLLSALADQAALALEKAHLDEIGEFRELLIGIVGHDLRQPLRTIGMASRLMLQHGVLGAMETELVGTITASVSVAAKLIDQLLDLTRSRLGGGIPIDPKRFDMREVFQDVMGDTALLHPDRPLSLDARGDLNGVWDRDRIHQLLGNLVGNAVQHGKPRSSIALRIEGRETEVLLEVANQGEPISPPLLPFVFEAFRQARNDGSPRTGLGLGLYISEQITRAHGGSIAITSSVSEGTTLRVRLPRGTAAASPRAAHRV